MKKTPTPSKPPGAHDKPRWNAITAATAIAPQAVEPGHVALSLSQRLRHGALCCLRTEQYQPVLEIGPLGPKGLKSAGPRQTQRSAGAGGSADPRMQQDVPICPSPSVFFDMATPSPVIPDQEILLLYLGRPLVILKAHREAPRCSKNSPGDPHLSGQLPVLNSPSKVHTGPACHEKA